MLMGKDLIQLDLYVCMWFGWVVLLLRFFLIFLFIFYIWMQWEFGLLLFDVNV